MKIQPLLFALTAFVVAPAALSAASQSTFELRLVVDCSSDAVALVDPQSGDKFCFSSDLILDRSNIVDVRKIRTRGFYATEAVRITINAEAIARLTAATTQAVRGRDRIGFIYNANLVSVPFAMEPVTGNQLEIVGWTGVALDAAVADLRSGLSQ